MMKSVAHIPAVAAMCATAKEVLGYDLLAGAYTRSLPSST